MTLEQTHDAFKEIVAHHMLALSGGFTPQGQSDYDYVRRASVQKYHTDVRFNAFVTACVAELLEVLTDPTPGATPDSPARSSAPPADRK